MAKKRKKFFKWCVYLFAISIIALATIYTFESDFRSTINSTLVLSAQSARSGRLFRSSEDYLSYTHLLSTRLKLGIHRTIRKYLRNEEVKKTTFLGYTVRCFDLRVVEFSFIEIFLNLPYFFKCEKKSPLVIDCGSNIGMSILFFKTIYPEAEIIAFEPSGPTFDLLKDNVESNRLKNVTLHKAALSNMEGELRFYYNKPGDLRASLIDSRSNRYYETVKAVKLSQYIDREVDFLKVDVEGAEGLIFDDLHSSGKLNLIRAMVVEYHHHIDSETDNMSRILWILESNKFGYQVLAGGRLPFKARYFQDVLIYAYRKSTNSGGL
jgi:FkbM family methyltransferase